MNFRKKRSKRTPGINLTPVLDMVFILLIFFAVSTSFIFTGVLDVELQQAANSDGNKQKSYNVIVTKNNLIKFNGKIVDLKNLEDALKIAYTAKPDLTLVIEADKAALHGVVVSVIDVGKAAGFTKFAIATEEPGH